MNKNLQTKWWQWAFSIPANENPVADDTGKNCNKGDLGKLFFLAGTTGGSAERDCTISHLQAVLFPVINNECSLLEGNGPTIKDLKKCNNDIVGKVSHVEASLDGTNIDLSHARVQSPPFKLNVIEDDVFGLQGSGTTISVADGYWVLLRPLSVGDHLLHFKGAIESFNFEVEVTYHLKVT